MDQKLLACFLVLADELHFARASELCHMTPSALSRAIKRLETELGQPVFLRDNRSVRLTRTGELFRQYARDAQRRWQDFQRELEGQTHSYQGELSLYCSVTASYSLLAPLLQHFRDRYPDVDIKLHTGDQAEAVQRVLSGSEDLSIAARPDRLPRPLAFQTITHSPLRFIAPTIQCALSQQLNSAQTSAGLAYALERLPLIVSEQGLTRQRVEHWFRRQGIRPNIDAQVSGHEAIVSMVGLGFGIGVVPELVLRHSPLKDSIQVLDVEPALETFAIGLCALKQGLASPLVRLFWDYVEEALDQLALG